MEYRDGIAAIAGVFLILTLLECSVGDFIQRKLGKSRDALLDTLSAILVPGLMIPSVLFASLMIASHVLPSEQDAWSQWHPALMFGLLCLGDDLPQYWWHRLSHTSWLFPLHRAHHSAPYLSVRVVYRNNLIYYALMPGLWISGFLIYLGFGEVYVYYASLKLLVIATAHSNVRWDQPLLRFRITRALLWIVERTFSTPMTHAAHHGLHAHDPATHYQGNFGNLLFVWDILFGTAKITRQLPTEYGVERLTPVPWWRELLIPSRSRLIEPTSLDR